MRVAAPSSCDMKLKLSSNCNQGWKVVWMAAKIKLDQILVQVRLSPDWAPWATDWPPVARQQDAHLAPGGDPTVTNLDTVACFRSCNSIRVLSGSEEFRYLVYGRVRVGKWHGQADHCHIRTDEDAAPARWFNNLIRMPPGQLPVEVRLDPMTEPEHAKWLEDCISIWGTLGFLRKSWWM